MIPRTQPRRWRSYRSDLECPCCICVAWSEKEEFPTGDRHPQIRSLGRAVEIIEVRYHKGALRLGKIDKAGVRIAAALL
jgi:hypothetical protein